MLRAAARFRVAQWNARLRNCEMIQSAILLKHCNTAAETEFGRTHSLKRVRSYEDFKAQVPLRKYGDFESDLIRMRQGARDVLWPGLIPFYGQSSGSSSTALQHKFLPISWEQIGWQKKAGFDLVARYLNLTGDRGFTGGFSLGLFPPSVLKTESPGVQVGSNPGIMLRHVPQLAKMITLPRQPIRDILDYDEKLTAIAETYFDYDVRSISGTTCWFSVLFDRMLEVAKARDLNFTKISEIWPNLRVLFGGGVHAEPYRKIIDERVGRAVTLIDNYNATEGGIFSATDCLEDDSMVMIPDRGVFFEFIPRAEHGKPNAKRIPLWKVEPDVDYSVAVTTSSGLWAYCIGDFVRFSSVSPHRMVFAGRASGVLSLTQELTSFIELEKSFGVATRQHSCTIVDFTGSTEVGVDATGKGRYVFFVEFEQPPQDLAGFTASVEAELCRQNRVYREHRTNNVAILPPKLVPLAAGSAKKFMEMLGYGSVQNKFPRVIDERQRDLIGTLASPP